MNTKNILTKLLCLLFLFSVSGSLSLKAEVVKKTDIRKVALNAFSDFSKKAQNELRIVQEIPVTHQDTALFYVLNFEEGFIIVAADDIVEPVLGYGLTSRFDFNDIPPALNFLLEGYKEEIVFAKRLNLRASQEINNKWKDYLDDTPDKERSSGLGLGTAQANVYIAGTYLIETTWGQDKGSADGSTVSYNSYCPTVPQGKTIVGCGGVALAQILNYWKCSVHPQGSVSYLHSSLGTISLNFSQQSYNWLNMVARYANLENAKLLFHSAVAAKSQFGISSTSSFMSDVDSALSANFGFSNVISRDRNYNNYDEWANFLKAEINNRRPVYYMGTAENGANGHSWVVDGYANNFFHCNWGWRGSHDGWFSLSNLTAVSGYNLNYWHAAIMNIYPTYYTGITLQNTSLTSNTYTGYTIRVANCTIQNNANVILKANCTTEIFGPFTVPVGARLEISK
ncbi:MAG: C10 family peptidase [Bacteroidetes bacterium]|nr:C10 family peptidase [Bacteroidota bacterium]MCL2302554.1 C10 family peptidase [Lentimicrobiaceae bacterium]